MRRRFGIFLSLNLLVSITAAYAEPIALVRTVVSSQPAVFSVDASAAPITETSGPGAGVRGGAQFFLPGNEAPGTDRIRMDFSAVVQGNDFETGMPADVTDPAFVTRLNLMLAVFEVMGLGEAIAGAEQDELLSGARPASVVERFVMTEDESGVADRLKAVEYKPRSNLLVRLFEGIGSLTKSISASGRPTADAPN